MGYFYILLGVIELLIVGFGGVFCVDDVDFDVLWYCYIVEFVVRLEWIW